MRVSRILTCPKEKLDKVEDLKLRHMELEIVLGCSPEVLCNLPDEGSESTRLKIFITTVNEVGTTQHPGKTNMTNTAERCPPGPSARPRVRTMTWTAWTLTSCRNCSSPLSLSISAWLTKRLRRPDREDRLLPGRALGRSPLLDMVKYLEHQASKKRQ